MLTFDREDGDVLFYRLRFSRLDFRLFHAIAAFIVISPPPMAPASHASDGCPPAIR